MKQCFLSQNGPRAIGPYSTAVVCGKICYMSGMIPVDPANGFLVKGGVVEQAHRTFENIKIVLEEMNLTMTQVLKTTIFMNDLANFAAVNEVYAEYFGPEYPARSCFQVSALPMGAMIEVECVVSME